MAGSTDQNGDSYLTRPFRRIAYPGLWSCARGSGGESYQNTQRSTRAIPTLGPHIITGPIYLHLCDALSGLEITHLWEGRYHCRAGGPQTPPDSAASLGGSRAAGRRSRAIVPPVEGRRWPARAAEMPMRLAVG